MNARSSIENGPAAPPHSGARPADLIEGTGSVYVLVGAVLELADGNEDAPVHVLVAPDAVRKYDPQFLPVFDFFRVPREEHQVLDWLDWAGGDAEFLQALLDTGSIVRVETRDPITAAESLRGIRFAPQCLPFEASPAPGFIHVRNDETDGECLTITAQLGEALWGEVVPTDVPSAVERVEEKFSLPRETAARGVLSDVPLLLLHGYARLEWLDVPPAG